MSISKQIGKYKAAARTRNKASGASNAEMRNAKRTARGGSTATKTSRGSWEGYQGGSSTYIHMNGSGYESKMNARKNGRRSMNFTPASKENAISKRRPNTDTSFDYRYSGGKGNSVDILSKRKRLDRKIR